MRTIFGGCLVLGLVGCSGVEKETEELVRESLKDPDSAQFKNVKGYCGEVNSKNSYGGYVGFNKFYISNGYPVFYDADAEDSSEFARGWIAHCESNSKLKTMEINACVEYSNFASSVVGAKLSGVLVSKLKNAIKASTESDKQIYFKTIDEGYKSNNRNAFALKILNDCLKGDITLPN